MVRRRRPATPVTDADKDVTDFCMDYRQPLVSIPPTRRILLLHTEVTPLTGYVGRSTTYGRSVEGTTSG